MKIKKGMVVIKQGNMVFTVRLLKKKEQPLYAPVHGEMNRTIHESTACLVGYELKKRNQIVFSFEEEMASFEYEYPF